MPDRKLSKPEENGGWAFLSHGGEMATRIRDHDWSGTLGPIGDWPQSLKTAVGIIIHSPVPIVMLWGPDGIMLYNDAYSVFAGGRHPQLLGSKVREGWPEVADFNDNIMKVVHGAGRTLSYRDQELTLNRTGEPQPAWMNLDYSPIIDESGKPGGVIAIVVETTERVLAERAAALEKTRLAQSQERLQLALSAGSGVGTWDWDVQGGLITADERFARLFGAAVEKARVGAPLSEFFSTAHPDDAARLQQSVDRALQSGGDFFEEFRLVQPDGTVRWVVAQGRCTRDSDGKPLRFSGISFDITDRKVVEIALQTANETLEQRVAERTADLENIRTFYTHSSECHAILALREDGEFQYDEINPATLALYGKTRDEVIGRTVSEIFSAESAAELNGYLTEALRTGVPYRYLRKQSAAVIEAIATPIPAEAGKLARLAVTARDITEQETLQEQLRQAQKMEAVGQLTGGIAHDFNNLLQGITGSLDRVQHRIAEGRANEVDRFLKAAVEAANRAASLTHRLLAFSRRQTLDTRPADVNRIIGGMEDMIRRTMGPAITVEVVGAAGLWPVRVDISQLENSLLNLCINARDAMPDGGKLTIETANKWMDARAAKERELPEGQYVSLCVTDTGTGMTPEVIDRAFDPFFTTKPLGQGTGLGLSMIYGFVRQSGGQIRVYSEVGKGTTMCLYFPRYLGNAEEESAATSQENVEPGFGEVVLVVDDEATVRMLVTEVLVEAGYKVMEAPDGAMGLKVLQSGVRVDLLITDVGLPGGMNGRQVADAARVLRPDLKVLFITGYAENAAVGNGHLDAGMEILAKPFAMSTLANKVREMLER
ncbi:MAG TPA: PAS domain-containing protein [Rhizomicrobium sp.]|nr:PAS domain-containing protein [Rhizomicrobium sp.]